MAYGRGVPLGTVPLFPFPFYVVHNMFSAASYVPCVRSFRVALSKMLLSIDEMPLLAFSMVVRCHGQGTLTVSHWKDSIHNVVRLCKLRLGNSRILVDFAPPRGLNSWCGRSDVVRGPSGVAVGPSEQKNWTTHVA